MKKVLLVTNIPAPYTVDLIYYMQTSIKEYSFHVLYTAKTEDNRMWKYDERKLINSTFADSKIIKLKTRYDYRYVHITSGITKILNEVNPDVIIGWEYNITAIQSAHWCKKNKKKYISLTEGTLLSERDLSVLQKITRKYICKRSICHLASGTKAKEKLLSWGVPINRIFIEMLTVDIEPFNWKRKNTVEGRIVFVGSLAERKGLDLLFHALKKIETNYCLHIIGNGTEEEKKLLEKIAIEGGINDKLVWCGYKSGEDLIKEYAEAQVFVFPTREDCFGLVLVEALAMHVPIVSSIYADGAYDIVQDGENGYFANPFSPEDLASKIDKILNNVLDLDTIDRIDSEIIDKFKFSEVSKGFIEAIEYAQRH